MTDATLRGDCDRCIGLCCVALAFDRGPSFGFDKAAGEVCRHLDGHRCEIHSQLGRSGMRGCARYDCRGAGPMVTAMFAGQSWRDNPATARVMFLAFAKLTQIQTMRALLVRSGASEMPAGFAPEGGWTLANLLVADIAALRREVGAVVKGSGFR